MGTSYTSRTGLLGIETALEARELYQERLIRLLY
jgi:hypothetical protein